MFFFIELHIYLILITYSILKDQADLKCALDESTLSPISTNTRWTCGRRWKIFEPQGIRSNLIRKRQDVMNMLRTSWMWQVKTSPIIRVMIKKLKTYWKIFAPVGLLWKKCYFDLWVHFMALKQHHHWYLLKAQLCDFFYQICPEPTIPRLFDTSPQRSQPIWLLLWPSP